MANARPRGLDESLIDDFRAHGGQMTSGPFTPRSLLLREQDQRKIPVVVLERI